ncbi:hypothetical protein B0J14DRAFT_495098 [Halenospora varia]|nr:hypothetical protein B0J14DRAFT_495098 [Halenospora varia]
MESQSLHRLGPLKCWHCTAPHSATQESCMACNGWTLPTHKIETLPTHSGKPLTTRVPIEWITFEIEASDSKEKGKLMKEAVMAIEHDQYVAILGIQIGKDRFGHKTRKTVIFLHRPGGDKRMSVDKRKDRASSRRWAVIKDFDLEALKKVMGDVTITYSGKDLEEYSFLAQELTE